MDVQLTLINQSSATESVVIFQHNNVEMLDTLMMAWQVAENLAPGGSFPFTFSDSLQVSANDDSSTCTPTIVADLGHLYDVFVDGTNSFIQDTGPSDQPTLIQVANVTPYTGIRANLYRGGALLLTLVAPSGKIAPFQLDSTIYIGVANDVVQGKSIGPFNAIKITKTLSLANIASADVVMTGSVEPFEFTLANIVSAP